MTIAEELTWTADLTKLHGKILPRSTALAPDQKTTVQVIGNPDAMRAVEVVGEITDEASARQVAACMVMSVRLILPNWAGANKWLTDSLRDVKQRLSRFGPREHGSDGRFHVGRPDFHRGPLAAHHQFHRALPTIEDLL